MDSRRRTNFLRRQEPRTILFQTVERSLQFKFVVDKEIGERLVERRLIRRNDVKADARRIFIRLKGADDPV